MARRLLTLLSAMSLVLCVATCALWVRSYWVADTAYRGVPHPGREGEADLVRLTLARSECGGLLLLDGGGGPADPYAGLGARRAPAAGRYPGGAAHRLGFAADAGGGVTWLVVPHAALAAASAALPLAWAAGWLRRRRQQAAPAFEVVRPPPDPRP